MGLPRHRIAIVVTLVAGLLAASLAPVTAQQGHNPFPATPVAHDAGNTGWRVTAVTPLGIDGAAIAIAPDGTAIAGIGLDGSLCVWSLPQLEPTCAAFDRHIDPDSLAWSPDSSAVAFSTMAFIYFYDGDIYVFERADGAIHNLTDDGLEEINFFDSSHESTPIDVMPAWTPDSTAIVFSRTVYDDRDTLSNEIMRIPRAGGDPETLFSLRGLPASIYMPMHVLQDGSILYTVAFSDLGERKNGLWQLSPAGEPTRLMPGDVSAEFPVPAITNIWEGNGETRIIGLSPIRAAQSEITGPIAFSWSSVTGEVVPLKPTEDVPGRIVYPGPFSPDGETLLTLERQWGQVPLIKLQGPSASTTELPDAIGETGPGRPRSMAPTWSSANLVLIPPVLTTGAYLLTVEPATTGEAAGFPDLG